jgi:hypothetical protein
MAAWSRTDQRACLPPPAEATAARTNAQVANIDEPMRFEVRDPRRVVGHHLRSTVGGFPAGLLRLCGAGALCALWSSSGFAHVAL